MSGQDSELYARARLARDKLLSEFGSHPDVNLIGISSMPERSGLSPEIVLRIHVTDRWMQSKPEDRIAFPDQVDGIPVLVVRGDYKLE